ncbi:hypothetical protein [Flavobacterium alvei]|uniref:hypothetical protein n=1 Tax=Flavobacterium alvei TaxID=2080416 RepID=UPI0026EC2B04|nr:hypothetical protein [Flavobacterium alvei]
METIKNNFELLVEQIETKKKDLNLDNTPVFDGINLYEIFDEIENSLEKYRYETEKKSNDSRMELANVYLSI